MLNHAGKIEIMHENSDDNLNPDDIKFLNLYLSIYLNKGKKDLPGYALRL